MPMVSVPGTQRCCIRQGRAAVGGPIRDAEPCRGSHVACQPSGQLCFPLPSSDCGTDFFFFFLKTWTIFKVFTELITTLLLVYALVLLARRRMGSQLPD